MKAARTTALLAVAALGAAMALPAQSSVESRQLAPVQPRAWSSMAGVDTRAVMAMASGFATGPEAGPDAPYCDSDSLVADTLAHDFGESLVDDTRIGAAVTQLWGSPVMGTWTLVMARPDKTSCVVASGTGYSDGTNPQVYYAKAGVLG